MAYLFEWHEAERITNVAKHGIDFRDMAELFSGHHVVGSATTVDGEERRLVIGLLFGRYVTAIFTIRQNAVRVISARSARRGEREYYQEVFGIRIEADEGRR